jgi:predicted transcriptional regulator
MSLLLEEIASSSAPAGLLATTFQYKLFLEHHISRKEVMEEMPIQIKDITLFSVEEISRVLNRNTNTVRYYLKQGRLHGQKIYGKWVVSYVDLMIYLKMS